jgi:hypothetical protein
MSNASAMRFTQRNSLQSIFQNAMSSENILKILMRNLENYLKQYSEPKENLNIVRVLLKQYVALLEKKIISKYFYEYIINLTLVYRRLEVILKGSLLHLTQII